MGGYERVEKRPSAKKKGGAAHCPWGGAEIGAIPKERAQKKKSSAGDGSEEKGAEEMRKKNICSILRGGRTL